MLPTTSLGGGRTTEQKHSEWKTQAHPILHEPCGSSREGLSIEPLSTINSLSSPALYHLLLLTS